MNQGVLVQELESLKSENAVYRRKLDSKCEALLILSRDLDQCRQERDQFKLMAEQVQERYQDLKRQLAGVGPRRTPLDGTEFTDKSSHNLAQLICEMRDVNKVLQFEVDDQKQKLKDAQGDIKLLREQIARQRVGTTDEGINTRHFPAHEREELVNKLEVSKDEVIQVQRDLQQIIDEKEELVTERDVYKNKFDRLNNELNSILKGDENRLVDLDALLMESKYLKERAKQMEEEKNIAMVTLSKYKGILERKKVRGIEKLGQSRSGSVVVTQKQIAQLLEEKLKLPATPQMVADLQSLAGALLETVNDKNLALSHQKKTNRLLGNRISELENKLKTLEVSGLWNIPGGANLDRLRKECEEIRTLIPKQASESSSLEETPETSPVHELSHARLSSHGGHNLEDLDLLPTKEDIGHDQSAGDCVLLGTSGTVSYGRKSKLHHTKVSLDDPILQAASQSKESDDRDEAQPDDPLLTDSMVELRSTSAGASGECDASSDCLKPLLRHEDMNDEGGLTHNALSYATSNLNLLEKS